MNHNLHNMFLPKRCCGFGVQTKKFEAVKQVMESVMEPKVGSKSCKNNASMAISISGVFLGFTFKV